MINREDPQNPEDKNINPKITSGLSPKESKSASYEEENKRIRDNLKLAHHDYDKSIDNQIDRSAIKVEAAPEHFRELCSACKIKLDRYRKKTNFTPGKIALDLAKLLRDKTGIVCNFESHDVNRFMREDCPPGIPKVGRSTTKPYKLMQAIQCLPPLSALLERADDSELGEIHEK